MATRTEYMYVYIVPVIVGAVVAVLEEGAIALTSSSNILWEKCRSGTKIKTLWTKKRDDNNKK